MSWIHHNVSETIKKSIIYFNTAREAWVQLERRFTASHGIEKFRLSKQVYNTKQNGESVTEYYTKMCVIWEEI